jgi:hypothetical protein
MTFAELSTGAEGLHLRVRQVDALQPPKVTVIQDAGVNSFAFLNADGLPLVTVEEAAEVIDAIEDADYAAWLRRL